MKSELPLPLFHKSLGPLLEAHTGRTVVAVIQISCWQPWLEPGMKLSLPGAAVLSHMAGDTPNPPLSCVLSLGKILFRRSHVRDVAVKRLKPIDEYCRVRALGRSALLPAHGGAQGTTNTGISLLNSADIHHRERWASQSPPRLPGQVETGCCLLPRSSQHFPWQTLCTGLVPHPLSKGSKPRLP